jgi:hypothetical protein
MKYNKIMSKGIKSSTLVVVLFILLLISWSSLIYLTLRYQDLKTHYNVMLQDLQQAHDELAKPVK